MRELCALTRLELLDLYGVNRFRHTRDPRERRRCVGLGCVWSFLLLMICVYVCGLVYGLYRLGLAAVVPAYLATAAGLIILAFGVFKAGHAIFSPHAFDQLASMPLQDRTIVASRFLALYVQDLLLTLLILLPGLLTYGGLTHAAPGLYLTALVGALFLPVLPLVLSAILGTLAAILSAGARHRAAAQTVLMLLLLLLVFAGSYALRSAPVRFDAAQLTNLAAVLGASLARIYPPAAWLSRAMVAGELSGLVLLIVLSAALAALALALATRCFRPVLHRLQMTSARQDYQLGRLEARSLLRALWRREARRYFASGVYVTNTIVGPILGCLLSAALLAFGTDWMTESLPPELPLDIPALLPYLLAMTFCMMPTTCTSISMEGKQFWAIRSLPIPAKALFDGKLLLNLSLLLPCFAVSALLAALALRPALPELLWLILLPLVLMLFSCVFGITVNRRLHRFDWEKEMTVVKQSAEAGIGGLSGPLLALLLGAVLELAAPPALRAPLKAASLLLLLAATALLYRANLRTRLETL